MSCVSIPDPISSDNTSIASTIRHWSPPQRTLLLPFQEDALIPAHEMTDLAKVMRDAGHNVQCEVLSSIYGHDAFLKEPDLLNQRLAQFLAL